MGHRGYPPRCLILVLAMLLAPFFMSGASWAEEEPAITIVVSEPIRPYLEAVDGFREVLEANYRVIYLKDEGINPDPPQDLWVAVGPQAMRELWQKREISRKIYMMVLHPHRVLDKEASPCGIPLDLSYPFQFRMLNQAFPKIQRIGVLFDPRFNQSLVNEAREAASSVGIALVDLKVESQKDIPKVLKSHWSKLDALWLIPDRTVINETIIRYLSKESLLHNVALLGYNQFFLESGAAMAFVIDYRELGRKTAHLAQSFIKENFCWSMLPPSRLWVKSRVLEHLGWSVPDPPLSFVELK